MLPKSLVQLLACPFCKDDVEVEEARVVCKGAECGLIFPIRDGIPVFLIEEAGKPCPGCGGERRFDADALICSVCDTAFRVDPP